MEDNSPEYKYQEEHDNNTLVEEENAVYGNSIDGNDWMKDYNKEYPLTIDELHFPTVEHYLQYRRYCYTMGAEKCQEFYIYLVSKDFSSYYELLNHVNEKIPYHRSKSIEGIYELLYQDYVLVRLIKTLKNKEVKSCVYKMHKEHIVPKQVEHCDTSSIIDPEEQELLKKTLMHIDCKSVYGNKKDPWIIIANLIAAQRDDA